MAKRQMIIEIDEQDYERLQRDSYHSFDKYMAYLAVKDGKLLPKGHGRLIDADKLELDDGYSNYDGYYHKYSQSQIYNAPTIIEAEESDSE